jgi:hypothetical protein
LTENYRYSSIQLGLWLLGACEWISHGSYDTIIEALALYVHGKSNGSSGFNFFYLRIGYEFDSALNGYDPVQYKAAFVRIVKAFRRLNVTNCAFVWHSSGEEPRDSIVSKRLFKDCIYDTRNRPRFNPLQQLPPYIHTSNQYIRTYTGACTSGRVILP